MLQCVHSVVDPSWRQSVVRTKKWRSDPCGLNVTISASSDWSVAIFTKSLESQESYLTLGNLTLQITRDFFRLHSTFARLFNAAASPASRLRSVGSLAIIAITRTVKKSPSLFVLFIVVVALLFPECPNVPLYPQPAPRGNKCYQSRWKQMFFTMV